MTYIRSAIQHSCDNNPILFNDIEDQKVIYRELMESKRVFRF